MTNLARYKLDVTTGQMVMTKPGDDDTAVFLDAISKFFDTFRAAGYNDDQLGEAFRAATAAGVGTDWYGATRTYMQNWLQQSYPQVAQMQQAGSISSLPMMPIAAIAVGLLAILFFNKGKNNDVYR